MLQSLGGNKVPVKNAFEVRPNALLRDCFSSFALHNLGQSLDRQQDLLVDMRNCIGSPVVRPASNSLSTFSISIMVHLLARI